MIAHLRMLILILLLEMIACLTNADSLFPVYCIAIAGMQLFGVVLLFYNIVIKVTGNLIAINSRL